MAKKRPADGRGRAPRKSSSQRRDRRPARPRREPELIEDTGYELDNYAEEASYGDEDVFSDYADEDMLSEFSDDTNTFFTDEIALRERRGDRDRKRTDRKSDRKTGRKPDKKTDRRPDRKPGGKPQKKPQKKAEKKAEKRKPISPLQRKIYRILSYTAIAAIILIVGVILSLTVLFKTQVYEVDGNTMYDEDAIIEACGISKKENIFLAPKKPAEKRIKEAFPYIEDVTVSFKIPDTIKISIEEAVEGYLVKKSDGDYFLISTKGRILNEVNDASAYDLPVFVGPQLTSGGIGEYAEYEDDKVVEMIENITQTFTENGYTGITEIDASSMANISFTYDNRVVVKLGIPEDLDYKIRTAMTIINENLDKNQTGTIQGVLDVSRCNTTKRSYFNEQEIRPTENKPGVTPTTAPQSGDDASGDYSGGYESDEDYSYQNEGDYSYGYEEYDYYSGEYDGYGYYE